MKTKYSIYIAVLFLSVFHPKIFSDEIIPFTYTSFDQDKFLFRKTGVIYNKHVSETFKHGFRLQNNYFSQKSYSSTGSAIYYNFDKKFNNGNLFGYIGHDSQEFVGLVQYKHDITKNWYAEIFRERTIVDSKIGVQKEYYSTIDGIVLNYDALDRFSAAAIFLEQRISDGNVRDHQRYVATYTLIKQYGLHFRGEYKEYDSSLYTRDYFNPVNYKTLMFGPVYAKWFGDYKISAFYLQGDETINKVFDNTLTHYEVKYTRINDTGNIYISAKYGKLTNVKYFTYEYLGFEYTYRF